MKVNSGYDYVSAAKAGIKKDKKKGMVAQDYWNRKVSKEDKANSAFDLYTKILQAKNTETNRAIFLGYLFKNFRDKKLYKHLDESVENFNEFLAIPEIGIMRSTASSYIRIYEKYVEELNFDIMYLSEIGQGRLKLILPFVDKDPEEWLSRAKTWKLKDLLTQIRKEKKRRLASKPGLRVFLCHD